MVNNRAAPRRPHGAIGGPHRSARPLLHVSFVAPLPSLLPCVLPRPACVHVLPRPVSFRDSYCGAACVYFDTASDKDRPRRYFHTHALSLAPEKSMTFTKYGYGFKKLSNNFSQKRNEDRYTSLPQFCNLRRLMPVSPTIALLPFVHPQIADCAAVSGCPCRRGRLQSGSSPLFPCPADPSRGRAPPSDGATRLFVYD